MKFNEKLKQLREAKSLTQDQIASKLNITRQSVSKWEQGINEPDFATTKQLCNILDCSIEELIDDDKEVSNNRKEKRNKINKVLYYLNISLLVYASLIIFSFVAFANDEIIVNFYPKQTFQSKWCALTLSALFIFVLGIYLFIHKYLKNVKVFEKSKLLLNSSFLIISLVVIIISIVTLSISIANNNKGEIANYNFIVSLVLAFIIVMGPFTHSRFNKMNALFGYRTKLTLTNQDAWNKINNISAILLSIASLISFVLILIFIQYEWAISFMAVIFIGFIPIIIYHEILRKRYSSK